MHRLNKIKKRIENTTDGSWKPDVDNGLVCSEDTEPVIYCDLEGNIYCDKGDLDFIVNAKDDIKYLLYLINLLQKNKQNK